MKEMPFISSNYYVVFDKIAGHFIFGFEESNDTLAVRSALLSLRCPLRDTALYCLGSCSRSADTSLKEFQFGVDFSFSSCTPRLVPWNCYKLPETPAESLKELGLTSSELSEIIKKGE